MPITKKDIGYFFVELLIGVAFIVNLANIRICFLLVLTSFFLLLIKYLSKGFYENTIFILFLLSFFTFLLGGFCLNIFSEDYFSQFDKKTYYHIARSLYICLFFTSTTYDLVYARHKYKDEDLNPKEDNSKVQGIRKASLWVFYILSVFSVAANIERALFVSFNSYLSYYTTYVSRLPHFFANLASMSEVAFYVFVATMPSKKQCKRPILWFIIISAMSLGYGQRNGFVMSLVFIIIYYTIRHKTDDEVWISKRAIIGFVIAIPFFISALYAFNYIRTDREVRETGVGKQVVAFFDEQSGSAQVVGYGYELKTEIKKNGVNYSVAQITNIVTRNSAISALLGVRTYSGQTVENALRGTNYGSAITYHVMPYNYIAGIGMGTSYIAEAYHDFGYIGLILVNVLYGILLALLQSTKYTLLANKSRPFVTALLFMGLNNILYAPRSITFGFVSLTLTFTTLLTFVLLDVLSRFLEKFRRIN